MPFSPFHSDKIMFSVVDDIVDELGRKHFLELRFAKSFFKKFVNFSKEDFVVELQTNPGVTKRESQVLSYLAQGKNNNQIAQNMNVSVHTAKAHVQNIFKKLCVTDRTEAVVKAIKDDLIDI